MKTLHLKKSLIVTIAVLAAALFAGFAAFALVSSAESAAASSSAAEMAFSVSLINCFFFASSARSARER